MKAGSAHAIGRDAPASVTERLRYVCLPGAGFTGSTLLGFLLNAHPHCASVGAAVGFVPGVDPREHACSCGARFAECPFWRRVAERTRALGCPVDAARPGRWPTHFAPTGRPYLDALLIRSLRSNGLTALRDALVAPLPPLRRRLLASAEANRVLARVVLEEAGASVFVDTSRDHVRPKVLSIHPGLDVRVIHLVRDARANAASIMKHKGVPAREAARIWRRANLEAERNRRHLPEAHWLRLRYDELCRDVQGSMDRIADFLEVPRAPVPEDFRAVPHHIGGNAMRLGSAGEVREDTSWKERLSAADLEAITEVAGPLNRRLGFDWPATAG